MSVLLVFVLGGVQDPELKPKSFPDEGIRLGVPAMWRSALGSDPILIGARLEEEGLDPSPSLIVRHARTGKPNSLDGFALDLRKAAESEAIEFAVVEEKKIPIRGRKGVILVFMAKTDKDPEQARTIEVVRAGILLAPRRYVVVDLQYPADQAKRFRGLADSVLNSIELLPLKESKATTKGYEAYAAVLEKIAGFPSAFGVEQTLDFDLGKKTVGAWNLKVEDVSEESKPGYRFDRSLVIDLEKEGKTELSLTGFLSTDFAVQRIRASEKTTSQDGEMYEFSAEGTIKDGVLEVRRRIRGEETRYTTRVPKGTLFYDLVEIVMLRLVEYGKQTFHAPTISPFDEEVAPVQFEFSDLQKIRLDGKRHEATVVFLTKADRAHATYYIDAARNILMMKDRPFYMKPKKD